MEFPFFFFNLNKRNLKFSYKVKCICKCKQKPDGYSREKAMITLSNFIYFIGTRSQNYQDISEILTRQREL